MPGLQEVKGEFRVNTTVAGYQGRPKITPLSNGGFVVTWDSQHGGTDLDVYGQVYGADGYPVGSEFRVNNHVSSMQFDPAVAGLPGGGFVITWSSVGQDGSDVGVYGRLYSANGVPGSEFRVNSTTAGGQLQPSVTHLSSGGFVITWQSFGHDDVRVKDWGIFGQVYAANGSRVGGEFKINLDTFRDQELPEIAVLSDGGFVVAWENHLTSSVHLQRHNADGSRSGGERVPALNVPGPEHTPRIVGLAGGGFVVAWNANGSTPTARTEIFAQIYNSDGTLKGDIFRINDSSDHHQWLDSLVATADGGFLAAWSFEPSNGSGDQEVYVRSFDSNANPSSGDIPINDVTADDQTSASLAVLANGAIAAVWMSNGQDGSRFGVYGKIFSTGETDNYLPAVPTIDLKVTSDSGESSSDNVTNVTRPSFAGTAEPRSTVRIYLEELLVSTTTADANGAWSFDLAETLGPGTFDIRATSTDPAGNLSTSSTLAFTIAEPFSFAPFGSEFQVNSTTAGTQQNPAIVATADSRFVVVWESADESGSGIFAQAYYHEGTPLGDQFRVNSTVAGHQLHPAVSEFSYGGVVVTWTSADGVYARLYDGDFEALGGEIRVNTTTSSLPISTSVAAVHDSFGSLNGFVVVWHAADDVQGTGIYARLFSWNGEPAGAEFRPSTTTSANLQDPQVAAFPRGGYVVTWTSDDGSGLGVHGQLFGVDGQRIGAEFLVNSTIAGSQSNSSVAAFANGAFVVTWMSEQPGGADIYARVFQSDGSPAGSEFRVNSTILNNQAHPEVTALQTGGFVISWSSALQDGSENGIYAQAYQGDGTPVGDEFLVNTTTISAQTQPAITAMPGGNFVASWVSRNQDGDGDGIFAQMYRDTTDRVPPPAEEAGDLDAPEIPSPPDLAAESDSGLSSSDNLTNFRRPEFHGTAEPGSFVDIYAGTTAIARTRADRDGAWTAVVLDLLAEGPHSITAIATDAAGNVSAPSAILSITIDGVSPEMAAPDLAAASDSGASATDNVTNVRRPEIGGTAEPGSLVHVYDGTVLLGTTNAGPGGAWSFTSAAGLGEGNHSLTATATDASGNVSPASEPLSVTIDIAAPSAPSAPDLEAASDSGASATDDLTNDQRPEINGTAEPGSLVHVYDGTVLLGTTNAGPGGVWSFTSAADLGEGNHSLTATATDAAGNVSPASEPLIVIIDLAPPSAPSAPDLAAASDSGSSAIDDVTQILRPEISGTAEPGSLIHVYTGDYLLGTTSAGSGGAWIFTPASDLGAGSHSLTATATDAAGNASPASEPLSVTIDVAAPSGPSLDLAPASDSGASATDNFTNDHRPEIDGTAEPGSTIHVYAGVDLLGTTSADDDGAWSFTPAADLGEGSHDLTAVATDAAGNVSPASEPLSVTIDIAAPSAPSLDLDAASDSGTSAIDNVTNVRRPEISGTAGPGSLIHVYDGTVLLGTTNAGPGGAWSFTPAADLDQGSHSLTATATDTAGNGSASSEPLSVTIDTASPSTPSAPDLAAASDSGASAMDNVTNVRRPEISGTAEPGSLIHIYAGDNLLGKTNAGPGGAWSFTPAADLGQGSHDLTAVATDAVGNVSQASEPLSVTIDTAPPSTPSAPDLAAASDSGASATDNVTSELRPEIRGMAEPGSLIHLYAGAVLIGTTNAGPGGAWSFTPAADLGEGSHSLTATATDAAGNISPASGPLSITVDTAPPSAPSVPDLAAASDTGASATDNVTSELRPEIRGMAEPGSLIHIYAGAVLLGTTNAGPGGAWSFTPAADLGAGSHSLTATATDAAGNVSPASEPLSVTIDTASPSTPSAPDLAAASDSGASATDNVTNVRRPEISGTAEPGSLIHVYADDSLLGTTNAGPGGAWSFTPTADLGQGSHNLIATATGASGLVSPASEPLSVTIDTASPSTPSAPDLAEASDSGASATDNVTSELRPEIRGMAEPGSLIHLYSGEALIGTISAGATGTWSFTPAADLGEGSHSLTATATDAAGNVSPASAPLSVTIDTIGPDAPAVRSFATSDTTPWLRGTAEAGSAITIYDGGGVEVGTAVADSVGAWEFELPAPLPDGLYTFTAVAIDLAGNSSPVSGALSVTIDTVSSSPLSAPDLEAASDSGASATDDVTSVARPEISGTAEPDSIIRVYAGADLLGTTSAGATGTWSFTPAADLGEGSHSLTATATDAAGNVSPASAPLSVTIDTIGPDAPAVRSFATSDTTPWLRGTAEAGSAITIYDSDGVELGTATAGSRGRWEFQVPIPLLDGLYTFTAVATDLAGNASAVGSGLVSVEVFGQVINGGNGRDIIVGTDGRDTINGGNGRDDISGGWAPDRLKGGNGNDILDGGAGDDILFGGAGNDQLIGGTGADRFVFSQGSGDDIIRDFDVWSDRLVLDRIGVQSSRTGDFDRDGAADDLLIGFTQGGGSVTLLNVSNLVDVSLATFSDASGSSAINGVASAPSANLPAAILDHRDNSPGLQELFAAAAGSFAPLEPLAEASFVI